MITSIEMKNFKAFDHVSLDLGPVNILLGPNNSGKSSVIAAPRMLVQTLESYDNGVPLLLNGVMGDFGTFKDIVHGNHRARRIELVLQLLPERSIGSLDPEEGTEQADQNQNITLSLAYKYRTQRRELVLQELKMSEGSRSLLETHYSPDSERQLIDRVGGRQVPNALKSSLSASLRLHNFIPHVYVFMARRAEEGRLAEFITKTTENKIRRINRVGSFVYQQLSNCEYMGALRTPPDRTYLITGERRGRVGAAGEYASNILALDEMRGKGRKRQIKQIISEWFTKAGMATDIDIVALSDRHYEIRFQHPITGEYQNFADVGYGHSQVLPVLVGGYNISPGSTYFIEQPEIHLHPRAQAELGDFLVDLKERGVQTIVETHSEHLVLRLQQYVASGRISPQDIRFFYVHANSERKFIKKMSIDERGVFKDDWPGGFFPERLAEATAIAKQRAKRDAEE